MARMEKLAKWQLGVKMRRSGGRLLLPVYPDEPTNWRFACTSFSGE
jgi:hypothetical protein